MKILYHHRTRSTDAQRIHIQAIVEAFEELGHTVEIAGLVPVEKEQQNAERDAGEAWWKTLARKIPFAYDFLQLGYNAVGIPLLLAKVLRGNAAFIYERYSLYNFAGVVTAWLCRIPIVLEVNSPFALEQGRDGDIKTAGFAEWCERVICNLATKVIVVSSPLKRIMVEMGVAAGKIEVMTNGVSLDRFRAGVRSGDLARSLGLEGSAVIGFVGWFRKWHGLELLIEAFHLSGLAAERVKVLLIGDGPAMADLRGQVASLGLAGSVVFSGPVPHRDVPPYLDLVDIAVQPAANEYCCPMKILEYMALGKPVVAPRQDNIVEILREGREAVYFPPEDAAGLAQALRSMVGDPENARSMGNNARRAITERGYLWSANALRVLEFVVRESGAGPVELAERTGKIPT